MCSNSPFSSHCCRCEQTPHPNLPKHASSPDADKRPCFPLCRAFDTTENTHFTLFSAFSQQKLEEDTTEKLAIWPQGPRYFAAIIAMHCREGEISGGGTSMEGWHVSHNLCIFTGTQPQQDKDKIFFEKHQTLVSLVKLGVLVGVDGFLLRSVLFFWSPLRKSLCLCFSLFRGSTLGTSGDDCFWSA